MWLDERMGNPVPEVKAKITRVKARCEKYATARHNRLKSSAAPLMRYQATFATNRDAELAAAVLRASGAVAVHADESEVVAVVPRPRAARSLHASAKAIQQPLSEAGLEPQAAFVHRTPSEGGLTWHTPSLGHHNRPNEAEINALRTLPAQYAKADEPVPVAQHPRLHLTDRPEAVFVPWFWWTSGAFWVWLSIAASVNVAGSGGGFSPSIGVAALALTYSAIKLSAQLTRKVKWRVVWVIGALVLAYGFGLYWGQTSPGPVSWLALLAGVLIVTLYVGVFLTIYTLLRRSHLAGTTVLAFGALVAGALGASNWFSQSLAGSFEAGLGRPRAALPFSTLDLLALAPQQSLLALIGIVLVACGLVGIHALVREERVGDLLLMVPMLAFVFLVLVTPLYLAVENVGMQVRDGNLAGAGRIATCVELGSSSDGPLPTRWSAPGVLVGTLSGPALFFETVAGAQEGSVVVLSGGLAAREVAAVRCQPARK